ncbi:hypothetical protein [Prevotella dentasini]|uniref:hypothetical protein n=1 Tax=Prevotella dentasini TaxID=589537 RepID=UPI000A999226|nr:hypothetical protein [Prevotella dentasini]
MRLNFREALPPLGRAGGGRQFGLAGRCQPVRCKTYSLVLLPTTRHLRANHCLPVSVSGRQRAAS